MSKIRFKILISIFFLVLITALWSRNGYLLILFSLSSFFILPIKKYWDHSAFMLAFFSFFYFAMSLMTNQFSSGSALVVYLISPVCFYRFGRWIMSYFNEDHERYKFLFFIILCYLSSLFIITVKDIVLVGLVNESRVMLDEMNNEGTLSATLYGLMASVGIGCISALFNKGNNIGIRLGYLLLAIFSTLVIIHLVNRTGIVIFCVCVIVSFFVSTKRKLVGVLFMLFIICAVAMVVVNTDIINGEVIEAYSKRETNVAYDSTQLGGRAEIWSDAMSKLLTHPFGWARVHYAHNLWLDIGRIGGWFSLLCFLIATVQWIKNCFQIYNRRTTPFISIILSINVAMFLASFVEPVIEGSILFFLLFMMFWGCLTSVSREYIP